MLPNRITIKLFITNPVALDLPAFILLFHRWIQQGAVDGLLIDVADYKHVAGGPGVMLIGHEGDYALDMGDGRPGLRYSRKRGWDDVPGEAEEQLAARLRNLFRLVLRATQLLEEDPALDGRLTFRTDEIELSFPDRLHAPNSPESFDRLRRPLERVVDELYVGHDARLSQVDNDRRRPLAVRVDVPGAPELATLVARLAETAVAEGTFV